MLFLSLIYFISSFIDVIFIYFILKFKLTSFILFLNLIYLI